MFPFNIPSSLPVALGLFFVSLIIVIAASTRFTRKLEELCVAFNLSVGMLSLLSALGANIPNYVASALAIFAGHDDVGIGIIVGSNIYNLAIILGLCTFFTPERAGMTLNTQEKRDIRTIVRYTFVITLLSFVVIAWLPDEPSLSTIHTTHIVLLLAALGTLGIFGAFLLHLIRRPRGGKGISLHPHDHPKREASWSILRLGSEIIFTLVVALGGVLVMVQSGQTMTADVHMPSVLAGLLVLAVATSLPNTVVAISLVRTGEAAACIEEVCNSGSINTALGIVLPLVFLSGFLEDRSVLSLDAPLTLVLTIGVFFWVVRGRISRIAGALLLVTYMTWVLLRLWM
ncbi:cation transporter [Ktedonobacter sp. SOSP1-85]|uniref:Cation transporter n=1 Tax=Ktedonobacter robiniae TaxID=2778365 RepID=A0ABQ3UGW1_9CHLR|nr:MULTISPECIES: hypothetical protein [Ktedonobacter]GHO51945.1 cation transporter [Ktedonobacter robiniae]GHO76637.1 cation transporter [Ktedonobacter sp. SOSP1-85]